MCLIRSVDDVCGGEIKGGGFMEACQASELATGRNEFRLLSNDKDLPNWEAHLETPSLCAYFENAADFKTPKKVRVISGMVKEELDDYVEVEEIGSVSPLNIDITNWTPLEGDKKTTGNMAVRKVAS